ncbi:hypothetical protein GUY44_13660 [Pimelobacter simplex]|uniref:Uncharacterized protein n=1 Tax=Nocardioides simplex TaxID=2045 RepID=A0A0J9YH54_NOCSI|nr:hypothetical protein [Pimelobacter simplex]AIY17256.1 hypothetical protein KR76_11730 [Pimelobacter simplex]MCG8151533.1 hypothetical protein [Pimelobacter simplex]GEB13283.1 hypothetical protein NSI01_15980 [Pimelobacter simplex]SFM46999.1 hypothetical protein SAMN05421671_1748 [Pimelobacter simplex]
MSREHLHRKALKKYIESTPGVRHTLMLPDEVVTVRQLDRVDPLDQPLNGVCAPCNNGWLNDVDSAAEPTVVALALRRRSHLRERECKRFARWAFRTAVMRAHLDRKAKLEIDPELVAEFHRDGDVPEGVEVRVALTRFTPGIRTPGSNGQVHAAQQEVESGTITIMGTINVVTWTLGSLYVHVIVPSAGATKSAAALAAEVDSVAGGSLALVWPGAGNVSLSDGLTNDVMARIGRPGHLMADDELHDSDFALPFVPGGEA